MGAVDLVWVNYSVNLTDRLTKLWSISLSYRQDFAENGHVARLCLRVLITRRMGHEKVSHVPIFSTIGLMFRSSSQLSPYPVISILLPSKLTQPPQRQANVRQTNHERFPSTT